MHLPEKSLTIPESAVIYTLHCPNKKYTIVPTIIRYKNKTALILTAYPLMRYSDSGITLPSLWTLHIRMTISVYPVLIAIYLLPDESCLFCRQTIIQNYQPVMAICIRLQILLNVIF